MFRNSRRNIFRLAGVAASAILSGRRGSAQTQPNQMDLKKYQPNLQGEAARQPRRVVYNPEPFPPLERRSTVGLSHGEDRRKNVYEALMAIDDEIKPKLKDKKYVLIKPNNVGTVGQLGMTHADAIRGILDYVSTRFKGPVVIGESSAGNTMQGFENFKYTQLAGEYKQQKITLVDFNEEAKYVVLPLIDFDLHVVPARLAARCFDPGAFIISSAVMKVHNIAVVSLAVKNMVLGAPLHQAPKETARWSDKRRYHAGIRQSLYNIYLTASKMAPFWGAAVIDGFEGIEGGFGVGGTPVNSRLAIASTDFISTDRVGAEVMGVDPNWLGWMKYCGETGVGQWDLARIDVRGARLAEVQKKYRLHPDIELQLKWMGPMEELPPNLGWVRPVTDYIPA
jgi:uncharacterized protein (DUF362 family)